MSANMKDIKNRINSVKNSSQITNAMNIVSSTKFKKFQNLTLKARDYSNTLDVLFKNLLEGLGNDKHILFKGKKEVKRIGIIVMTSDRGLCGGFNSNTIKKLDSMKKEFEKQGKTISLINVGRKSMEYARDNKIDVDSEYIQLIPELMFEKSKSISEDIVDYYLNDLYDEVYLIYSKFQSIINYELTVEKIMPFKLKDEHMSTKKSFFVFEPSKEEVLIKFIPKMLNIKIYQAMLENTASEHSARMNAMKSASDNAQELIDKLTLEYNRVRQAIITQELTEIVSGANALK